MESSPYLRLLKRWWWTLFIAMWVAGLVGYTVALGIPPTYETQTRLLVGPLNADFDTQRAAGQLAQTYAELATSQPILETVVASVGADLTTAELAANLDVRADSTTRLVALTVRAGSPELAVALADELGLQIEALADVSGPAEGPLPEGQVTIIDPAIAPSAPVAPQVSLIVVLAAGSGLVGAAAIVLLIEYATDIVRDRHDLTVAQPVLGVVSSFRSSSAKDLRTRVAGLAREPTVADPLRHLAGKLAIANGGSMPRSLLIVGARMGDGAGALATNLAMALSEGGRKVTLVDANGHEREASEMLQTSASLGTVDALMASTGRATDRIVQRQPGLSLLPYGSVEPVVELTDTAAPKRMVSQLAGKADLVVVNGPPMDRSASAVAWSRVTDATLFVVHANYVSRRQVLTALDDLDRAHANSVAIVISQRRPGRSRRGKRPPQEAVEKTAEPPVQPVSVGAGSPHTDGNASTGRRGRRRVGRNSEGH